MQAHDEDFDFDLMSRLAQEDPMEFSRRREGLIALAIASCRCPEHAREIQGEIDAEGRHLPPGVPSYLAMARCLGSSVNYVRNPVKPVRNSADS